VNRRVEQAETKTVSNLLREALEKGGYRDVKECAKAIRVPYDLFNKVMGGHIPKDQQLMDYAKKLKIDYRELIMTAYREKAPDEMKKYFNSVALLEQHDEITQETLEILDSLTTDQKKELLALSRIIRQSPRDACRKTTSLMALYQQMTPDLADHFNSLVLLSLRNDKLEGLKEFRRVVAETKQPRKSRGGM